MGLLSLGTPMDWYTSRKYNNHVRQVGISQLINIFAIHSQRQNDPFLWGDEIEYMLVDINNKDKTAKLSVDNDYILHSLNDGGVSFQKCIDNNISFHPEYGRYMLESTPMYPFTGEIANYTTVEPNMSSRRLVAQQELPPHVIPLTITSFPRMGCSESVETVEDLTYNIAHSLYLPDQIINKHIRFPTLTQNILKRRGSKVAINIPIYKDVNTSPDIIPKRELFESDKEAWYEPDPVENGQLAAHASKINAAKPNHIYLDAMGFGMGMSCLQITMQTPDLSEARYLFDALVPVAPIMLALSSATPIMKGRLVGQDCRWNVISGSVDDRTLFERGEGSCDPQDSKVKDISGEDLNKFGGLDVDLSSIEDCINNNVCGSNGEKSELIEGIVTNLNNGNHFKNAKVNNNGTENGKAMNEGPIIKNGTLKAQPVNIENEHSNGDTNIKLKDGNYIKRIPKSRYESINQYLNTPDSTTSYFQPKYNDAPTPQNSNIYNELTQSGMDHYLASHFAYLFIRDPLVVFNERVNQTKEDIDHFENLQSTNWQTLRFKPPPPQQSDSVSIGWRVEFRPMEIQPTDFENSAYSIFMSLLSQAILKFRPNFYIPISQVDENMGVCNTLEGFKKGFWFRNDWCVKNEDFMNFGLNWFDNKTEKDFLNEGSPDLTQESSKYSINDIINGTAKTPGLIHLIIKFISLQSNSSESDLEHIKYALMLVSYRASGKIQTVSTYIRSYVLNHPDYKQDSHISKSINYDLLEKLAELSDLNESLLDEFFGVEIARYLRERKY